MEESMVLEEYKEKLNKAEDKKQLLNIFRKLVILEIRCLKSNDREVREIGYKAQTLQGKIEDKILGV